MKHLDQQMSDAGISNDERTKCEVWTRVMGYHRPIESFNPGKQSEFAERKPFEESAVTR